MKTIDQMSLEEQMRIVKEYDALTDRVKLFIWEKTKDFFAAYLTDGLFRFTLSIASQVQNIRECESPIEQLLMLAMWDRFCCTTDYCAHIEAQKQLQVSGNKYRVDFLITIIDDIQGHVHARDTKERKRFERYLVVECDGHDFHEKTKQQAKKDKQRDRHLQISGYPVLRFTGSEIYKDPLKCCLEVESYILVSQSKTELH